jgi:hypothetical protein
LWRDFIIQLRKDIGSDPATFAMATELTHQWIKTRTAGNKTGIFPAGRAEAA